MSSQEQETFGGVNMIDEWLREVGFSYNPFDQLHAERDPRTLEYFVEPQVGLVDELVRPEHSVVFVPGFGGKTTLQLAVRQWLERDSGSDLYPISYRALNLIWYATGYVDLLDMHQRAIRAAVLEGIHAGIKEEVGHPVTGEDLVERMKEQGINPDDFATISRLVETLAAQGQVPALLVDDVDKLPETMDDPDQIAVMLAPLVGLPEVFDKRMFIKAFLPTEAGEGLREQLRDFYKQATVARVVWTRDKLVEVLRRRVAVATGVSEEAASLGMLRGKGRWEINGSLDEWVIDTISSPDLLGNATTPFHVFWLVRRALGHRADRKDMKGGLQRADIEYALERFREEFQRWP